MASPLNSTKHLRTHTNFSQTLPKLFYEASITLIPKSSISQEKETRGQCVYMQKSS